MHVHQLSITYVPEQDRIQVRVNTRQGQELRLWLTRRIALGLAPMLDRAVDALAARQCGLDGAQAVAMDDMARKAITQFRRAENLKASDFTTPYQTSPDSVDVFGQPILVTEVSAAPLTGGQLRLGFAEKLTGEPAQRSFQLSLTDQLLHAFVHLLEGALGQSQWRDALAVTSAQPAAPDASQGPDAHRYRH